MWQVIQIDGGYWQIVNIDGILRIDRIFNNKKEAQQKCDNLNDCGGFCHDCPRRHQ